MQRFRYKMAFVAVSLVFTLYSVIPAHARRANDFMPPLPAALGARSSMTLLATALFNSRRTRHAHYITVSLSRLATAGFQSRAPMMKPPILFICRMFPRLERYCFYYQRLLRRSARRWATSG